MLERRHARTKIIATLGPASGSLSRIRELVRGGVDAFRVNMSHGDVATRRKWAQAVRQVRKELERPVALIADLRGPRLRLGQFDGPLRLRRGQELRLVPGRRTRLSGALPVDYRRLLRDLKPGHRVLLRDGRVELVVRTVDARGLLCRVRRGDEVSSNQGVNLPDSGVSAPCLAAKDHADLDFAAAEGFDWIALSFVRSAADLQGLRRALQRRRFDAGIIAKIELPAAVERLDEILAATDAVMVARGDLAVEMGHSVVPLVQKRVIAASLERAVPVITATQMLESMIDHSQPTRAEVSDVANAVLDGSDAVMLSGETAVGRFPLEAVRVVNRILDKTEHSLYAGTEQRQGSAGGQVRASPAVDAATVSAAVQAARQSQARLILAFTETGRAAKLISSFRPALPIIGLSSHWRTFHRMALYWGVRPAWMPPVRSLPEMYRRAAQTLRRVSWLKEDDLVVSLTGAFQVSGATNTVRLLRLSQLGSAAGRPPLETT